MSFQRQTETDRDRQRQTEAVRDKQRQTETFQELPRPQIRTQDGQLCRVHPRRALRELRFDKKTRGSSLLSSRLWMSTPPPRGVRQASGFLVQSW